MRLEIKKVLEKKIGGKTNEWYEAIIDGKVYVGYEIFRKLYGITGEDEQGILGDSEDFSLRIVIGADVKYFPWGMLSEIKSVDVLQREIQARINEFLLWRSTLEQKIVQVFALEV